jgi:predicted extracellular nuclease
MPVHRSFVLLIALALALGALLQMAAPMATRAVSTTVTISQVYGGGGNEGATYTHDFIELYNLTDAPIDLSGLSLQYASATGTGNFGANSGQLTELSGTIPAGGHFLVQEATQGGGTTPLPSPDLIDPTPINMSGSSGKVALVTGTTSLGCNGGSAPCGGDQLARIVDLVGWGTANFFEGAPAPATTNATAVIRDDAGATDTDNNAADFTAGPPTPRSGGGGGSTDPTGIGAANPSTVETGGTTLLTVTVTPGANPTSAGLTVEADLSSIGGSNPQQFFDDATNGDATPGDNVFSFSAIVPAATAVGPKSIPAIIEDAQGRDGDASINLTVIAPTEPTEIWEIQGAGHVSPLAGTTAFDVEGVVTAVSGSGFWMTDATPDEDPFTSDGLFVFRGSGAKPAVGAMVQVDGPVVEFRPGGGGGFENLTITEITTPNTFSVLSTGNVLPVTVIGEAGRMPPHEIIDDDTAGGDGTIDGAGAVTTYDPASDGIDFWESLEGMRLQVADAVAVGPTAFFGSVSREIAVVSGTTAGMRTPRGGILVRNLGAVGDYRTGDFNPERLILANTLAALPEVNVGDGFATDPVGVLDYTFGNYKLFVTADPGRLDNGLIREEADRTGARELAVATYNVENLTVGNPQAKFDQLADQIIHNLQAPDLIAIEEMQDDSGGANNGVVTAQAGWDKLIATIVNRGGPAYQFRSIDPVNNADGGAPGSNIRVGFLFRTDRGLEFVDRPGGNATTDTGVDPTPNGKGAQLTISPGRVLPDPAGPLATAFVDTRKSLAGEFRWRGETLFVVANHFSSKGDDHPLFGRFQPPERFTEFQSGTPEDGWRHAQAQVVNDFVDEVLAVDDDAHVIVLGDINDFHFSETVGVLTGVLVAGSGGRDADGSGPTAPTGEAPVLATLFDGLAAEEQYSYVFEGNSQVLDQILVSTSLVELDPRYDVVHVNAEFASQASDHDPSVMRVSFQPRRGR